MKRFWSLSRKGRLVGLALLTATAFACGGEDGLDGGDGAAALVETSDASAEECEHGGVVITTGLDANGDGVLSEDEIVSTAVICDGAPGEAGAEGAEGNQGAAGADGDGGEDGASSLVVFEEEPAGANCAEGGVRVLSGVDADGDGALSSEEVAATDYVCNISCTADDYSLELGESDAGEVVYNGFDTVAFPTVSASAAAEGLVAGALQATEGFEFELEFDSAEGLMVSPISGEGTLDILVALTDGCGFIVQGVSIPNIADGESTVYVGNFFGGAGEVDLNLAGTEDLFTTIGFAELLGPGVVVSSVYALDAVVGGDVIGTTPELVFAPEKTYMVYAYSDEGELAFGYEEVDPTEPAEGKLQARFNHLAEGVGTVDIYLIGDLDQAGALGLESGQSSALTELDTSDDYVVIDTTGNSIPDLEFPDMEGFFAESGIFDVFIFQVGNLSFLAAVNYTTGEVVQSFVGEEEVEVSNGLDSPLTHSGAYPSVDGFVGHGNNENAEPGESGYREFTVPGASTVRLILTYQIENSYDFLEIRDLASGEELARLTGPPGGSLNNLYGTAVIDVPSNTFSIGVVSDGSISWDGWRLDGVMAFP